MADPSETLFDRIGGAPAVADMIDDFYTRVLADHVLRPFFETSTFERLAALQKEFFSAALDGPVSRTDIDLARIHRGMGITREHLTRFVHHLIDVLDERSAITRKDAMEILFRIATFSDQVIGESGGVGG